MVWKSEFYLICSHFAPPKNSLILLRFAYPRDRKNTPNVAFFLFSTVSERIDLKFLIICGWESIRVSHSAFSLIVIMEPTGERGQGLLNTELGESFVVDVWRYVVFPMLSSVHAATWNTVRSVGKNDIYRAFFCKFRTYRYA